MDLHPPRQPATAPCDPTVNPRTGKPLRILHALMPGRYGGLESVVQALARGQAERGYGVTVAAVVDPATADEHPFFAPIVDGGAALEVIHVRGREYLQERAALRSLMLRLQPDIVHTHGYRADVLAGSAARGILIPVVSTAHGFAGGDWKNRAYEWLQRLSLRRFDAVAAVSRSLAAELGRRGVPASRLHTIPNAWSPGQPAVDRVAARSALGIAEDEWAVGFVGRLSWEKGADVLVDALSYLRDLRIRLHVLGDGTHAPALRERAEEIGVADRVRWHGAVPAAGSLFRAFDVFVLSSRTEGTPIALFEAMAADVPVVATAVGGVPDVVSPAEAILVPPENPAALGSAIRACNVDVASSKARVTAAASRLARERATEPWLSRYEDLYLTLLRSEGRGQWS